MNDVLACVNQNSFENLIIQNRFIVSVIFSLFLAAAPVAAQDVITFRDRAAKPEKITTVTGDIHEEKFTGVKIKPTVGPEREIPAGDIIDIVYVVPGAVNIDYKSAMASEDRRAATDAGRKAMEDAEKVCAIVLSKLKDEADARIGVPAIQMLGLGEIGVAAQQRLSEAGTETKFQGAIRLGGRSLVGGSVAASVHDAENFKRCRGFGRRDRSECWRR
jgi:hypothetical protein